MCFLYIFTATTFVVFHFLYLLYTDNLNLSNEFKKYVNKVFGFEILRRSIYNNREVIIFQYRYLCALLISEHTPDVHIDQETVEPLDSSISPGQCQSRSCGFCPLDDSFEIFCGYPNVIFFGTGNRCESTLMLDEVAKVYLGLCCHSNCAHAMIHTVFKKNFCRRFIK